jgi:hypothetical protein
MATIKMTGTTMLVLKWAITTEVAMFPTMRRKPLLRFKHHLEVRAAFLWEVDSMMSLMLIVTVQKRDR